MPPVAWAKRDPAGARASTVMATWHEPPCAVSSCLRVNWPSHRRRASERPSQSSGGACRPCGAGGSAAVCMARGCRNRHGGVGRPGPGTPGTPPTPMALSCGALSHRFNYAAHATGTSRTPRAGRASPDGLWLSPRRCEATVQGIPAEEKGGRSWRRPSAPSAVRKPVRASRPIRSKIPLWNPAFVGSESCGHQPCMARETRTDCRLGDAHGRRLAGVQRDPEASQTLPAHP